MPYHQGPFFIEQFSNSLFSFARKRVKTFSCTQALLYQWHLSRVETDIFFCVSPFILTKTIENGVSVFKIVRFHPSIAFSEGKGSDPSTLEIVRLQNDVFTKFGISLISSAFLDYFRADYRRKRIKKNTFSHQNALGPTHTNTAKDGGTRWSRKDILL